MDEYRESLLKTFVPLVLGSLAGVISYVITDGVRSRDPLGIIVLVFLIYVNKFLLPKLGVKLEGKDWGGITLISFASWYVVWTLLLNL